MKKIIVVLLTWSVAFTMNAQPGKPSPPNNQKEMHPKKHDAQERAHKMTEEMAKNLNLSDEQRLKVMSINVDKNQKVDVIGIKRQEANKAFKEELEKLEKERQADLSKVLTKEQFQKFLQTNPGRQQHKMTDNHKPGMGKPH